MTIRKGHINDLAELQQLFVDTITNICKNDYTIEQIGAWTSSIANKQRWQDVMTNQLVLVAETNKGIAGFCTLDGGKYIDLLYVHKECQRQGVAFKLYDAIEKEAKRQGQTELSAEVSKTARAFFERVGFKIQKEQTVSIKGVELTNYKMTKDLK